MTTRRPRRQPAPARPRRARLLAAGAALLWVGVTRASASWPAAAVGAVLAVARDARRRPAGRPPGGPRITWPFVALAGVIGRLARQNALRVPSRTAATASALMIGLALVAGVSVIAQSAKVSVADVLSRELTSDFVLRGHRVGRRPLVRSARQSRPSRRSGRSPGPAWSASDRRVAVGATVTSAAGLADNIVVAMMSGPLTALAGDPVLVNQTTATDQGGPSARSSRRGGT